MNNNNNRRSYHRQAGVNVHPINILVWNVQGARSAQFLKAFKEHIRMQRPRVVALVETHIFCDRAQTVCDKIGFGGCFRVEAQGF